jgi:hypothetical protein
MKGLVHFWVMIPAMLVLPAAALALPAASAMRPTVEPPRSVIVPAYSSNAHRSDGAGNYGAYKGRRSSPPPAPRIAPRGLKQPYPYRYYSDNNRSISGCRWMAKRAIRTKNMNWWARYRACRD